MAYQLQVNGTAFSTEASGDTALVDVLRDDLGLRGTKIGCGQGECGACSVMMGERVVCSCLTPVSRATLFPITTIEGICGQGVEDIDASLTPDQSRLHPIQQAFIDHGALQCGFCTPGMIVAAYALLNRGGRVTEDDVVEGLTGNLCRCTGYRKIIEAVLDAGERMQRHE